MEGLGLYSLLTESKMCARITSLTNEPGLPLREIVGLKRRTVFPTALRWREGLLGKGRQGFELFKLKKCGEVFFSVGLASGSSAR